MKKTIIAPILAVFILITCLSFVYNRGAQITFNGSTRVSILLDSLGAKKASHLRVELDPEKVSIGKQLVYQSWAMVDGKKSKLISKYFVCTDCHNQIIEDVDLAHPNPITRLEKSVKENIPFLQGTTFYGAVNRKSWYNEDYYLKYGEWVAPAKDTLENAIQLCAKVCSSGRYLEGWELEAITQYFNTLDYKIEDLNLNDSELEKIKNPNVGNEAKIQLIESKYLSYSPATFLPIPASKDRQLGKNGSPQKGKQIYVQSCMSCHTDQKEVTSLKLDTNNLSLGFFRRTVKMDIEPSIYNIVRDGTKSEFAIKSYMPHYTKDRMSEQQLEDLVSYIMSKKP